MIRENENDTISPNEDSDTLGKYLLGVFGGKLKGLFCMDPQPSFIIFGM
jgi:hypothetical protein